MTQPSGPEPGGSTDGRGLGKVWLRFASFVLGGFLQPSLIAGSGSFL